MFMICIHYRSQVEPNKVLVLKIGNVMKEEVEEHQGRQKVVKSLLSS